MAFVRVADSERVTCKYMKNLYYLATGEFFFCSSSFPPRCFPFVSLQASSISLRVPLLPTAHTKGSLLLHTQNYTLLYPKTLCVYLFFFYGSVSTHLSSTLTHLLRLLFLSFTHFTPPTLCMHYSSEMNNQQCNDKGTTTRKRTTSDSLPLRLANLAYNAPSRSISLCSHFSPDHTSLFFTPFKYGPTRLPRKKKENKIKKKN